MTKNGCRHCEERSDEAIHSPEVGNSAPFRHSGGMRIVFMGSPEFAVPSLNALVEAGHEVVAAYAQPPRPAGRGKAERRTAVHQRADELGIEVRTPKTLRDPDEQARFRALDADLAVVAAY